MGSENEKDQSRVQKGNLLNMFKIPRKNTEKLKKSKCETNFRNK